MCLAARWLLTVDVSQANVIQHSWKLTQITSFIGVDLSLCVCVWSCLCVCAVSVCRVGGVTSRVRYSLLILCVALFLSCCRVVVTLLHMCHALSGARQANVFTDVLRVVSPVSALLCVFCVVRTMRKHQCSAGVVASPTLATCKGPPFCPFMLVSCPFNVVLSLSVLSVSLVVVILVSNSDVHRSRRAWKHTSYVHSHLSCMCCVLTKSTHTCLTIIHRNSKVGTLAGVCWFASGLSCMHGSDLVWLAWARSLQTAVQ